MYPIRILHVFGRVDRGGAETMVMNLYRNIDRSLIQFDFAVHTNDICDYEEEIIGLGGKILKNILHPIKLQISRNLDYELVVIGVV